MSDELIPQTGEVASDFELPDSTGTVRRLLQLAAERQLILIFYRGYW